MVIDSAPTVRGCGHTDGRALLEKLYTEYVGTPMPEILCTSRGKPYFKDSPVCFSISHTDSRVFCVLHDRPVGLDAERADRAIDLRLAEKILSQGEYAQFLQTEDSRQALLKFWVLKEAQAKATGLGLQGYPKDTDFSLSDPRLQLREGHVLAIITL